MKDVTIYSMERCPWCIKAKEFFKMKNIPFVEKDVRKDHQAALELMEYNPSGEVPVIVIDETIIIGFDEDAVMEAISAT